MRRRLGIAQSVAVATVSLAVVLIVEFVVVVILIDQLRGSASEARHSEEVIATANALEKTVLDLETGQRGFVITSDAAFLEPLRSARRTYPTLSQRLESLVADEPTELARARAIARGVREYDTRWAGPVVALTRHDPAKARARVATRAGKRRVDALRARFATFRAAERQLAEQHRSGTVRRGRIAEAVGIAALLVTLALVALYMRFVYGFAIAPIRRLGAVARRLRAGDLDARAPAERAVELAEVAEEFNAMADTLVLRRAELEAVLDSTGDGLLMADESGRIVFANRAMDETWHSLGIDVSGSIYERIVALAQLTGRAEEYAGVFARVARDPEMLYESEFAVGSRVFIGRTGPVHDASGRLLGRIFMLSEVTAERESERLKDEFVATVSHELRTPLTSIRGFIELLLAGEGGELTRDQERFLKVVDRNSERLLRLVGDLLLMAQLDAGTLRLQLDDVDLGQVAEDAVEAARPAARDAGLRLELELDGAPPVRADRARIAQLVDNLVSNAIKFTPGGGTVEVAAGSADGAATLAVRDTGPGMSPQELENLFARFYRTRRAAEQQVPGTGLGLAISQAIAEAHGGSITVTSREGEGTTFTLRLPVAGDG